MELLEHFFEHPPQNEHFHPRKVRFPSAARINLHGARGCGKTALGLEYVKQSSETTLYIDLESPSLILTPLETLSLEEFLSEHNIDTLILDHYEEGMLDRFPDVAKLIVISRTPVAEEGFVRVELMPLDYEEFLAFNPSATPTVAFNRFLRGGSLPGINRHLRSAPLEMKRFFQHQFAPGEQSLVLMLARYNTQPLTTHQIYTFTREHFRISKDFVYDAIKRFEREGLIRFAPNAIKRSGKKMFFYDFAFAKYLAVDQPFGVQFESMVAATLFKHGVAFSMLGLHEFLTNDGTLTLPLPFEDEERFWVKAQQRFGYYKKHGIRRVVLVTVANTFAFDIEAIRFEAMPFYEWSITHTEDDT
jgi:predicted AAA+ superfamily ATPase